MALLSIVLPAYNEEENISNTAKVLSGVLSDNQIDYELVFISDGSRDETFSEICKAAAENPRIKGAEFSRNFGKEAAIFAGLKMAAGNAVIVMDCDLQHPPQVIPQMWRKWQEGAEVVEGIKLSRGKESLGYRLSAGLFYKIMSRLINMDMNASSDFKLLDRKVVDVLLTLPERNTFFRALSFWVGFRTESVSYEVQERQYGESKWSFFSLMKYAVTNATSFSTLPLQMVTVLGVAAILFSIILFFQTLAKYLSGTAVEGFTTVIFLILIIGGFLMLSLGIIGHYIARIYEEVKGRPKYIIRRAIGGESTVQDCGPSVHQKMPMQGCGPSVHQKMPMQGCGPSVHQKMPVQDCDSGVSQRMPVQDCDPSVHQKMPMQKCNPVSEQENARRKCVSTPEQESTAQKCDTGFEPEEPGE